MKWNLESAIEHFNLWLQGYVQISEVYQRPFDVSQIKWI